MTDAIEQKLDGIKTVMDSRLSLFEREMSGVVSWMERLAATVEKLSEFGSTLQVSQQRQAATEATVSDMALDIDGLDTRVSALESDRKADAVLTGGMKVLLGGIAGAAISAIVGKLV